MPRDLTYLDALKHSIVQDLFIDTADNNYVLARWSVLKGLDLDFLWLAVHCLEKYLKAVLLLNGKSARNQQHNIVALYREVEELAPELLPGQLEQPSGWDFPDWRVESPETFIEQLYRDGEAHNRYLLYGYVVFTQYLIKLDALVAHVRRLALPLDANFLGRHYDAAPNLTSRLDLAHSAIIGESITGRLGEIVDGRHGDDLRHALLNNNPFFSPEGYPHTEIRYGSSSRNPVLVRRLLDPLEAGPENYPVADELWAWVKSNIYLPGKLVKAYETERDRLKANPIAGTTPE